MVSIPACHAGYPGSIPGRGAFFNYFTFLCFICLLRLIWADIKLNFMWCLLSSHQWLSFWAALKRSLINLIWILRLIMAQQALQDALQDYNKTIENNFKSNWGSLLQFLGKLTKPRLNLSMIKQSHSWHRWQGHYHTDEKSQSASRTTNAEIAIQNKRPCLTQTKCIRRLRVQSNRQQLNVLFFQATGRPSRCREVRLANSLRRGSRLQREVPLTVKLNGLDLACVPMAPN